MPRKKLTLQPDEEGSDDMEDDQLLQSKQDVSLDSDFDYMEDSDDEPRHQMKKTYRQPAPGAPNTRGAMAAAANANLTCSRCKKTFATLQRLKSHRRKIVPCTPEPLESEFLLSLPDTPMTKYARMDAGLSPLFAQLDQGIGTRSKAKQTPDMYDSKSPKFKRKPPKPRPPPPISPAAIKQEWTCIANHVINFKLVRHVSDLDSKESFHPDYTHQFWPDEGIYGYKGLQVDIFMISGSLYTYLKVTWDKALPENEREDVYGKITARLQPGWTENIEEFKKQIGKPWSPPGQKLGDYVLEGDEKKKISYEFYLGGFNTPKLRQYHERLQFFVLMFIDRGSYIKPDEVWEVLMLVEKTVSDLKANAKPVYNLVGYTTLYKFYAYPQESLRMRLSQILIMPPFQRKGHGQKLLQQVYDIAETRKYLQVTVEAPAPVFQLVRDVTDALNCIKQGFFQKKGNEKRIRSLAEFDKKYAAEASVALRITPGQVRRCYEIFKLASIDVRDEEEYTKYKIEIRTRLYHHHEPEIVTTMDDPEDRKNRLDELYRFLEDGYLTVIKRLKQQAGS